MDYWRISTCVSCILKISCFPYRKITYVSFYNRFFDTKSDLTAHTTVLNNKNMMIKTYVDWFLLKKSIIFSNIDTSISSSDVGWRDDSENIKKSISKICGLRLYCIPPAIYSTLILNMLRYFIAWIKWQLKLKTENSWSISSPINNYYYKLNCNMQIN